MYVTKQHQFADQNSILALIEANALGTWIKSGDFDPVVNHVPFFLDRIYSGTGTPPGGAGYAGSGP